LGTDGVEAVEAGSDWAQGKGMIIIKMLKEAIRELEARGLLVGIVAVKPCLDSEHSVLIRLVRGAYE